MLARGQNLIEIRPWQFPANRTTSPPLPKILGLPGSPHSKERILLSFTNQPASLRMSVESNAATHPQARFGSPFARPRTTIHTPNFPPPKNCDAPGSPHSKERILLSFTNQPANLCMSVESDASTHPPSPFREAIRPPTKSRNRPSSNFRPPQKMGTPGSPHSKQPIPLSPANQRASR